VALRVVFILYCLEAGFFFVLAPWTRFWLSNPLLTFNDSVVAVATNPYVRGFVSGVGIVHVFLGFRELVELVGGWRSSARRTG
jgi:hypothetical protein